jgi:hypothetical protein
VSTDITPVPGTMADLVQDFGDQLLNLYIVFDRGVGFHDASDLLDGLLDALVVRTEHVQARAVTAGRSTVQDVAAERLLYEVSQVLLLNARYYTAASVAGNTDDGDLLPKLLAWVFNISMTCVISGGAR